MFVFVSGGLSSGKSTYALRRAAELGPPPWLYVAPDVEGDDEFKVRLAKQRRDHDATWRLKDAPIHLDEILSTATSGFGALVIDRFSLWLAGRLVGSPPTADGDRALLTEIETLADRLYRSPVGSVVVTTEVGLGFLPVDSPKGAHDRRVIDVVGLANQILAERAQSVVFMVSGIPQRLR